MFPWITRALDGRLYEWALATPTLSLGVKLVIWPEMLRSSVFQWVSGYYEIFTLAIIAVGILRLFALSINGRSIVVGPITRSLCSFTSAVLWGQIAYALYLHDDQRGYMAFGMDFWISFTLAEIYVSYRAIMDVRRLS